MAQVVKIMGLRQTGTNYLTWLLTENFDVKPVSNTRGWKHGLYSEAYDEWLVAVVFKDPRSWLVSCYRHERKRKGWKSFRDFIEAEDAIIAWNLAAGYWLNIASFQENVHLVRYESLLASPETETMTLMGGNHRKDGPFQTPDCRIMPGPHLSDSVFVKRYYTRARWRRAYSDKRILSFVEKRVDWAAAAALEYSPGGDE